jgi:hypothetical protein
VIAILIAWLITDLVATYGVWHYLRSLVPLAPATQSPVAVILVAIKGVGDTTARFLDMLCRQRYPRYRVVFALESRSDPALRLLESRQASVPDHVPVDIVIAGTATQRTQKVHNLLAALGALRGEDRIVVFADADMQPGPDWLADLIRPIAIGEAAASTGYRWPLPADRRPATLVGAAADLSVTTSARSRHWNVCWGGSTAVERAALDAIDLRSVWDRAASDDVTLSQALRAHGFRINAPLRVLVPSPVSHTWTGLFSFARRQHLMVRTYAPWHWMLGGWTLCVPAIGAAFAFSGVLRGNPFAAGAALASIVLLQARVQIRRRIAALVLPGEALANARSTLAFGRWAWPLIHLVHTGAFLASCVGGSFTWAGIAYHLRGRTVTVGQRGGT